MARVAAEVDAQRQPMPLARLVDRPVAAPAQRLQRPHQHQGLHETGEGGDAVDLRRAELAVVVRQHDRRPQPGLRLQPLRRLPVVDGPAQRGAQLRVHLAGASVQAVEDPDVDAERIQQLLAQEPQAGAGRAAVGRPGVHPGRPGRCLRIRVALRQAVPGPGAEALQVPAPALGQVRPQPRVRRGLVVDVAVDQSGRDGGGHAFSLPGAGTSGERWRRNPPPAAARPRPPGAASTACPRAPAPRRTRPAARPRAAPSAAPSA